MPEERDARSAPGRRYRRHVHRSRAGVRGPTHHQQAADHAGRAGTRRAGGSARDPARRRCGRRRHRHRHPRHHACDQRDDRAQGRAHRTDHHRGLPRRDRDGQRKPLRPVRPEHHAPGTAGATPPAACRAGAPGQRRQCAAAARRGGGARAGADAAPGGRAEHCRRFPARLRQPAPRTPGAGILGEELPDIPVSLSSEVSPEMREWERFSTTVANAYVQPHMARYLRGLEAGLRVWALRRRCS